MSNPEDQLWELPSNWRWTTMGQIANVVGGGTPDTKVPANFGGPIPWITPADMSGHVGKAIEGGARSISEQGLVGSGARLLPQGAVLFSSRAPIGYTAVAARPVTTNQGFKSFIPCGGITSDYLYHWLSSAKEHAEELASGTTFLEISGAKAALIPFPLAPVSEQTRIVEKLEELLSDLDAAVAELKAAQRKLAQYRQSLLKAAVEGALTADWRAARAKTDEPQETGAELLQRVLAERRARWEVKQLAKFAVRDKTPPKGWQSKYKEPVAPDTADLPTLPHGWVWTSLDAVVAESSYGTSVKCSPEGQGTPVLRIPNISGGKLDLGKMKFASETLPLDLADHVSIGDVLVIRTNGSIGLVGRTAAVTSMPPVPHYFASYLLRLRCVDQTCAHVWISTFCTSPSGRRWIEQRAASSAGQHNVSLSTFLTMPIPLPPIEEQACALEFLARNLDVEDERRRDIETSLKQSAAQRKNILKTAFAGQLVPQDPSDEPAGALLKRIRAERAKHGSIAKKRARTPRKTA